MKRGLIAMVVVAAVAGAALYVWKARKGAPSAKPSVATKQLPAVPALTRKKGVTPTQTPVQARVSQDDDPHGTLRLEGQVVDADENPIAGAHVTIDSNPPRTVSTERDGSFAFDKLVGRRYEVSARQGARYAGPITSHLTKASDPVVLRMRQGSVIDVTVVDSASRKPIAGATVSLIDGGGPSPTTSADGVAAIAGVAPGWRRLRVEADGHGPVTRLVRISGTAGAHHKEHVALDPGAGISGTVVDAQGEPVAGAEVAAERASATFFDSTSVDVKTDAKGRFSLPAVGAGTYRLTARHRSHARGLSKLITVDGRTLTRGVTIRLGVGARVVGRVVTKAGTGVSSARVRLTTAAAGMRGFVRQVYCDESGTFDMSGLPRATVKLFASSDGASSSVLTLDLAATQPTDNVTLRLDVDGRIAGVVVDDAGDPVAEAQVVLQPTDVFSAMTDWRLRGRTADVADQAGTFSFTGVAAGTYRVAAAAPGSVRNMQVLAWAAGPTITAKPGDSNVRIVLHKDGSITGKVVFEDGSTPKAFTVQHSQRPATPFVDTKGTFTLRDVPSGTRELRISGGGILTKYVAKVRVKPGAETDVGTIEVQKGRSVRGRVLAESGSPVAGATVAASMFVMGDGSKLNTQVIEAAKTAVTSDDGRFELFGIGERQLMMIADHPTVGRSQIIAVPEGKHDVTMDVVVRATGGVSGRVTRGGAPVPSMVTAIPEGTDRARFMVRSGADGSYRFDRLAAGVYTLNAKNMASGMMVLTTGGMDSQATVTVVAGEVATAHIKIPVGPTVTVHIAAVGEGKPPNASVSLFKGNVKPKSMADLSKLGGSARTAPSLSGDMNMPARFDNVEPGDYTVCAFPLPPMQHGGGGRVRINMSDDVVPTCKPFTAKAAPEQQAMSLALAAAPTAVPGTAAPAPPKPTPRMPK